MKSTLQVYEYKIDSIDCTFFRIFEDESQIFPVFPRPRSMWSKVAGISFHTQVKKVSIPETGDVASRDGWDKIFSGSLRQPGFTNGGVILWNVVAKVRIDGVKMEVRMERVVMSCADGA